MNALASSPADDGWVAAPVVRVQRPAADAVVRVTTVGAEPDVAERVASGLADLLQRWDLADDRGVLTRLCRSHERLHVDDDTLLLLVLTTEATLELKTGVARLGPGRQPPPVDLIRALALDMTAQDLQEEPVAGFSVAINDDTVCAGTSPTGCGWPVDLGDPHGSPDDDRVWLHAGACFSIRGGAPDELAAITVHSDTAWRAALLALDTIGLTATDAVDVLTDAGVTARVQTRDGAADVGDWGHSAGLRGN